MKFKILVFSLILLLSLSGAFAVDVDVVNSRDWKDVYSVMLHSQQNENTGRFVYSESLTVLTGFLDQETMDITIYDASGELYISNLDSQLRSAGFNVVETTRSPDMSLELNPDVQTNYLISADNYRTAISLLPLAIKENAWVFIVTPENVGQVASALSDDKTVIAVGTFTRDVQSVIEPLIDERINNNDIYADSQEISSRFGEFESVVLADGGALEGEFFTGRNPIVLSGFNKILDDTYKFLVDEGVKNVVIVGNELAVVGEQIRDKSEKKISVFIKFGQSDSRNVGKVFALSFFPLPRPTVGLAIADAIYDTGSQQLLVTYENIGNVAVYYLSTVSVKEGETELASGASEEVQFLGIGESLIEAYPITIDVTELSDSTAVEFFTSYGASPSQLDSFITADDRFGPPFSIALELEQLSNDDSQLDVVSAAYYPNLKRIGVELLNPGSEEVFYNVKVVELIVNGIEQDLFKQDSLSPGETKMSYLPVELDEVDMLENDDFSIKINYGREDDFLIKTVDTSLPFLIIKTGLGLIAYIIIVVLVVLLIAGVGFFMMKRR